MGAYPAYDPTRKYPVMRERNDLRRLPVMRLVQEDGPVTLVDPSEDNPAALSLPGYRPRAEVLSRAPGAESALPPSDDQPRIRKQGRGRVGFVSVSIREGCYGVQRHSHGAA